ncbi:hypothetical protein SCA6_013616 [Theobroma cacao]
MKHDYAKDRVKLELGCERTEIRERVPKVIAVPDGILSTHVSWQSTSAPPVAAKRVEPDPPL